MAEPTRSQLAEVAKMVSELDKESYLVGEMPAIGDLLDTWKGPMVVIGHNYGGRGWVRCVALHKVMKNLPKD